MPDGSYVAADPTVETVTPAEDTHRSGARRWPGPAANRRFGSLQAPAKHNRTERGRPMADEQTAAADDTAVRVALWRAVHVQVDPPPHVLEDEIGLRLAAPDDGWRNRPDMDPAGTSPFRAA